MQDNRSIKIYKPTDIDGLLNIDKLQLKTKEDCARLLEETRKKCETLEKETYDAALNKLHAEQMDIFEQSYKKVTNFFDEAQVELNGILKVLFNKIKIDENAAKFLSNLLFSEVERLKIRCNKFTVYANNKILPILQANIKEEYTFNDNVFFDYDIKSELRSEECLIESDYVMVRISISDFQEKALKILAENNKI